MTIGFFIWILFTFAISCLNSVSVGAYWSEKSELPASLQVSLWAGAVMAVCGFFAVYIFPVTWVMVNFHIFELYASVLKVGLEPQDISNLVDVIFQIAYLLLIVPILGSGFVIWINSLVVAYQRRTFGSVAVAGWNTYAQIRNTANAVRFVPEAGKAVGKFFSNKKGANLMVWILLAGLPIIVSLGGAVFTAATIMQIADQKFQLDEMAKANS